MPLKYLGGGFLVGVPTCDLTDEQVQIYGKKWLLASGLYKEIKPPKEKVKAEIKQEDKE